MTTPPLILTLFHSFHLRHVPCLLTCLAFQSRLLVEGSRFVLTKFWESIYRRCGFYNRIAWLSTCMRHLARRASQADVEQYQTYGRTGGGLPALNFKFSNSCRLSDITVPWYRDKRCRRSCCLTHVYELHLKSYEFGMLFKTYR